MTASHAGEYLALRLLQAALGLLPLRTVRGVARGLGWFLFSVARFRRDIVLSNIRNAFPDSTPDFHHRVARESYGSVAVTLFEFILFPRMTSDDIGALVRISNPDLLSEALAEGSGVLLLTAHYGSWELFGQAAGLAAGSDGCLLMKVQSNRLVSDEVDRWRMRFGLRTTSASGGVRDVLRTLAGGGWVVIAADQAAPRESLVVTFFGREVPTYQGPASFALQTGAAILLGAARRLPDDTYEITFERLRYDDLSTPAGETMRRLTERHVRATEQLIMRDPGQWMWMHRRWKHVSAPER